MSEDTNKSRIKDGNKIHQKSIFHAVTEHDIAVVKRLWGDFDNAIRIKEYNTEKALEG